MQCPQPVSPQCPVPPPGAHTRPLTLASFLCPGSMGYGMDDRSESPASVLPSFSASSYPFLPAGLSLILSFCAPSWECLEVQTSTARGAEWGMLPSLAPVLVPLVILLLHRTRSCPGQWATRVSAATQPSICTFRPPRTTARSELLLAARCALSSFLMRRSPARSVSSFSLLCVRVIVPGHCRF